MDVGESELLLNIKDDDSVALVGLSDDDITVGREGVESSNLRRGEVGGKVNEFTVENSVLGAFQILFLAGGSSDGRKEYWGRSCTEGMLRVSLKGD